MKILLYNCKAWISENIFTDAVGFDSVSGKITFTGRITEADKQSYDEVIDLGKRLVLPAFTDGHCHFVQGAYINSQLNLREAKTKSDFEAGIKKFKNSGGKKWIQGGFFSESNFKEKFAPDKKFLDEVCSDVPVLVSRFDTHSAFANSKALELSGILDRENDFSYEEIIRDENGQLTGELKERAREFVFGSIPPPTLEESCNAVLNIINEFHSYGITSISDITLPEDLEVYGRLLDDGKLTIDVDARLPFREFHNLGKYSSRFTNTGLIKFKSLKAFYDGSLSSKTALMHHNYRNANHNGLKTDFVLSGEFEKMFFEIDKAGYQMSVHAIGDKAVTDLLDMNAELIRVNGAKDRRFRIEHAQHIRPDDFMRFKDLNVIASVQPSHLFSDAKTAYEIIDDYNLEHNYKKLLDIGARICFGTDFPVVSESPFYTIYYAMTRKVTGFENGFETGNCISLTDCLKAYTVENAFAMYCENDLGSITKGKFADLIVLENDLFEMKADEIRDAKVNLTYFRGRLVYEKK